MWELDHKEDWAPKNWCFQIMVLEKTLESPLDSKDIKPVNPKGNQPWISFRRSNAETEAPIFVPADMKSWLTGNDPDAGKDWGQEEKRTTEDEMVGWHHQLNGHESEQTQGDSEEHMSLACMGCKESDTWWLNNNNRRIRTSLTWRRKWQPTPVFLSENPMPEGSGRLESMGVTKSWTWLSTSTYTDTHTWAQPD